MIMLFLFTTVPKRKIFMVVVTNLYFIKLIQKKIAFIHADYEQSGLNTRHNKKNYLKFDKIATVSNSCKKVVLKHIPELQKKLFVVKNCINYNLINKLINIETVYYDDNEFNIITVARLSQEKGILRAIEVINELNNLNYKVKYHIIGDGPQKDEIINLIKNFSLENKVIIYGNQINPYKYMKNADLFLLPSYHEAAPMVIDEAIAIGLPILTTKTISAIEMVEKGKYGFVCENSKEGIKKSLIEILNRREILLDIKRRERRNLDNNISKLQFRQLLD